MISKKEFAAMQDHSVLESYQDERAIRQRIQEALSYGFAAVYVNPAWVRFAKEIVGDRCHVGTPVGYPIGAATTKIKIMEGIDAIENGADELDVVINISWIKSGYIKQAAEEMKEFVRAMKLKRSDVCVKIIIECCYLTHSEKLTACEIVAESGADYIKTSTGMGAWGCRIGDIRLIKKIVKNRCKIKAAADVKTIEQALAVISEGATRIGENTAIQMMQEWDNQMWF
jgi:deoxyribose-phosphate aldolase